MLTRIFCCVLSDFKISFKGGTQIFKLILMLVMLCVETPQLGVERYWANTCSCRGLLDTGVTSRAQFCIGDDSEISQSFE